MRSLDIVDVELVRFEQEPNNAEILANIFRLVHTIKGTCGFLGLPRLAALAHAAESLMGKFRDGMPVTGDAVTLILSTLDRIKEILDELEEEQREPDGADTDLIHELDGMAGAERAAAAPDQHNAGSLTYQVLERPLKPGEASLDELERAFRETPGPASAPDAHANEDVVRRAPEVREGRRQVRDPHRQSVDPRQCRHARTSDDHGVGAGADPQPAARNRAPAGREPNSRCRCSGCRMSPPSCRKA